MDMILVVVTAGCDFGIVVDDSGGSHDYSGWLW